jgi:hypothetical protein
MRNRRGGINAINILTAMLVAVTLLTCVLFAVFAVQPQLLPGPLADLLERPTAEAVVVQLPTRAAQVGVPTVTDTPEGPDRTGLLPTFTPVGGVPETDEVTVGTLRPTLTPSLTPFLPSRTPIPTDTPTPTNTPDATATNTPLPTNTRSQFQWTKTTDSPRFAEQRFYDVGCSWIGFAGQVFNLAGQPASGSYRVHVWDDRPNGVDIRAVVGDAPIYGQTAWEQFVGDEPFVWTFFLQLERVDGSPASQVYQVTTRASCRENLIYFDFIQNY